jgi:hypothetical protein
MSKVWLFILLSLGLIIKPSDVFGQFLNKAIFFDSLSGELPYTFYNDDGKIGVIGLMQDTTTNIFPILFEDSLGNAVGLKKYKSSCSIVYPTRTNKLGFQNGIKYFIANCNPSFNKFLMYKILIDSLGDTVKTYRINNSDTNLALRTHFLPNGDMLVLGQEAREYFLQKWRGDSLLWNYTSDLNGPFTLHNIFIDSNDVIISGRIGITTNPPGSDLFFAKFNSGGQLLWDLRKDLGESENMGGLTKYNNQYVISFTKAPWGNYFNFDLKTYLGVIDLNGNWINHIQIGEEGRGRVANENLLNAGTHLLYITGEHNLDYNRRETIFYKLNDDFEIQWERRYLFEDNTKHSSNVWDARIEPDSTIKTIGVLYNGPGGQDLWYLHLDKHGCLTPGCEVNDVSVEEVFWGKDSKLSTLVVFPNPFKETLQIKSENPIVEIQVFDVFGKLVFQKSKLTNQLEVGFLHKGIYLLKLKAENGEWVSQKVVKY